MSTTNDDIMKLSLTELLTRQYTSTITFLFDNESPSIAVQASEKKQKTVSNDIKNLNCTKLSLLIVKALLSSTTNTNSTTIDESATIEHDNNQLSSNDFQVKFKLNNGNNLILLDAGYYPTIGDEGTACIQSIGHLLHAIFTESPSLDYSPPE